MNTTRRAVADRAAVDARLRAECRNAQQRFAWSALLVVTALIAVIPPLIPILHLPVPSGAMPLSTRLGLTELVIAVAVVFWGRPRLRRLASLGIAIDGTAMLVLGGISLVDSGFDPQGTARYLLVVYALTLAAVTVRDVIGIFFFSFAAFVWYAAHTGTLSSPNAGWTMSTMILAYVLATTIAALNITYRRRENRARFRAQIEQEDQVAALRTRDSVTGLPNFDRFRELCADAAASASVRDSRFAIAKLDLDHFRRVIDQHGHHVGDRTMEAVARRFESAAPALIVCRGRGDEFYAVIPTLRTRHDAEDAVSRMLESLGRPFACAPDVHLTATAGLAVYPDDARTVDPLIERCELALSRAKKYARGSVGTFGAEDDDDVARRRRLRDDLPGAFARHQFQMHYQPYVDAATGQLVGAEALARWDHPELGLLAPAEFIELAESEDLMGALGDWAMREATAQCKQWWDAGLEIGVSFNVSASQFRDAALTERLRFAMEESGVEPTAVTIELTEGAAMENYANTLHVMHLCAELGTGIALDDFGTGYSSLARLKFLPITAIKIDKLFVQCLPDDRDGTTIVRSLIALAHNLGFDVCAEGVETAGQREWLRAEGCDVLQGFDVAHPMSASNFASWAKSYCAIPRPVGKPRRKASG